MLLDVLGDRVRNRDQAIQEPAARARQPGSGRPDVKVVRVVNSPDHPRAGLHEPRRYHGCQLGAETVSVDDVERFSTQEGQQTIGGSGIKPALAAQVHRADP